jgi:hypothetical protein
MPAGTYVRRKRIWHDDRSPLCSSSAQLRSPRGGQQACGRAGHVDANTNDGNLVHLHSFVGPVVPSFVDALLTLSDLNSALRFRADL